MVFGIFLVLSIAVPNLHDAGCGRCKAATQPSGILRVVMQKPGDPEKAIESEYEALKSQGTREALELFITRHPEHPLASKAREDLKRLNK